VDLTIPVREEVLRSAAEKAFRRFPYFARTIRLNEENAFELEPSDAPIVVKEEGAPITLGSEEEWKSQRKMFNLSATFFASYQALDATLDKDGNAKTIVENGYHRTETEIAKKNNTRSALMGAHLQADIGHFTIGATGYWQHFDRKLSPGTEIYRRWYPQGQDFGAVGLHGGYSQYRWTASAEVAYSTGHGGIATMGRVQWLVSRNLKIGALGRYYSHKFH
jgi:hypothetical protein